MGREGKEEITWRSNRRRRRPREVCLARGVPTKGLHFGVPGWTECHVGDLGVRERVRWS